MNQSPDGPAVPLMELLDYIERYAGEIPVEEMRPDGSMHRARLSELPAERALYWAFLWIRRGIVPYRMEGERGEARSAG